MTTRTPFTQVSAHERRRVFHDLLAREDPLIVPGVVDALTARLCERAGAACVYVTGAGVANAQLAVPDVGLTTMHDVVETARRVAAAVGLPVISDADTGYGNALNVMRTVHEFESAGAVAIQLEDQIAPKRCGHFEGKEVIDPDEMVMKIRAALRARSDPTFAIIARTDAAAVLGIDEALRRARLYRDAGADVLFVEAPRSREELMRIPREVPGVPHVVNVVEGGKTPRLPSAEFAAMGFQIVLYPNLALRVAARAVARALEHLLSSGSSAGLDDAMLSMDERQALVGLPLIEELEREFLKGK